MMSSARPIGVAERALRLARLTRSWVCRVPAFASVFGLAAAALVVVFVGYRRMYESEFWELATSIQDDSFYYIVPAFNFKSFGFYTFDGRSHTYGFQPMYEVILTFLALFFGQLFDFVRCALFVNVLAFAAAGAIAGRVVQEVAPARSSLSRGAQAVLAVAVAAAFFSNPLVLFSMTTGKENALAALLYAATILLGVRAARRGPGHLERRGAAALGLIVAALVLTRILPTTLAAAAVAVLIGLRAARRKLDFLVPAVGPIALWMLYAQISFRGIVPMSAKIKALAGRPLSALTIDESFEAARAYFLEVMKFSTGGKSRFFIPQMDASLVVQDLERMAHWQSVFFDSLRVLGVVAVYGAWRAWRGRRRPSVRRDTGALVAFLFAIASLAAYMLTGPLLIAKQGPDSPYYFSWYVYDLPVLAALVPGAAAAAVASPLLDRLARVPVPGWLASPSRWGMPVLAGVGSLWAAALALQDVGRCAEHFKPFASFRPDWGAWQHAMVMAAAWTRTNAPLEPGDRIVAYSSGALALVFPLQVVNLDGLANDDVARIRLVKGDVTAYALTVAPRYQLDVDVTEIFTDGRMDGTIVKSFPFPQYGGYRLVALSRGAR